MPRIDTAIVPDAFGTIALAQALRPDSCASPS